LYRKKSLKLILHIGKKDKLIVKKKLLACLTCLVYFSSVSAALSIELEQTLCTETAAISLLGCTVQYTLAADNREISCLSIMVCRQLLTVMESNDCVLISCLCFFFFQLITACAAAE
jgi:hypothetical protein